MKKLLLLFVLISTIGFAQRDVHPFNIKAETVNEMESVDINTRLIAWNLSTLEFEWIAVGDLPISGGSFDHILTEDLNVDDQRIVSNTGNEYLELINGRITINSTGQVVLNGTLITANADVTAPSVAVDSDAYDANWENDTTVPNRDDIWNLIENLNIGFDTSLDYTLSGNWTFNENILIGNGKKISFNGDVEISSLLGLNLMTFPNGGGLTMSGDKNIVIDTDDSTIETRNVTIADINSANSSVLITRLYADDKYATISSVPSSQLEFVEVTADSTYTLLEADLLASKPHFFNVNRPDTTPVDTVTVYMPEITWDNSLLVPSFFTENGSAIKVIPNSGNVTQKQFVLKTGTKDYASLTSKADNVWISTSEHWAVSDYTVPIPPFTSGLIINGEFDNADDLSLDEEYSVGTGTLNYDNTDLGYASFYLSEDVIDGETYQISFEISNAPADARFEILVRNASSGLIDWIDFTNYANGEHSFTHTHSGGDRGLLSIRSLTNGVFSIDNVSLIKL